MAKRLYLADQAIPVLRVPMAFRSGEVTIWLHRERPPITGDAQRKIEEATRIASGAAGRRVVLAPMNRRERKRFFEGAS